MNKNIVIVILVVIIIAAGGYFFFTRQGSAPAINPTPTIGQSNRTPAVYTDPSSFFGSFLQCSPSELRMPFSGTNTYVITVFGTDNGNCHYAYKLVDQNGAALMGEKDCKVPKELINDKLLGHLFGQDKNPGQEQILAEQTKIENDYCKK